MGRVRQALRRRPSFSTWRSGPQGRVLSVPPGTQLYLQNGSTPTGVGIQSLGGTRLDGGTSGWTVHPLATTAGTNDVILNSFNFAAGPTAGKEVSSTGPSSTEWLTLPVDTPVTISGTIMFNIWAYQSVATADSAINGILERVDSTGAVVSVIAQSSNTIELGTSAAVYQIGVTPTPTLLNKGDRLRFRPYFADAPVMGLGNGIVRAGGTTPGAVADTWIKFTETITFQTTEPSGTALYLTSAFGPSVGADEEREMWTSRGASATTAVVNTTTGPVYSSPVRWTDTAGGTAIEWYSRPVQAFTLSGLVCVNMRAMESSGTADAALRAEIAITDSDGSNPVVWGAASVRTASTLTGAYSIVGELNTSDGLVKGWVAGPDTNVTSGQRIRLRLYVVDSRDVMASGFTATLSYDGPTVSAAGDSWIQLPQSVLEAIGPTILGYWS